MRYAAAPRRRDELLRQLQDVGYVSSSAAAVALGVSEMTIRRDLRQLADEGLARRVIGGASWADGSTGRPFEVQMYEGAGHAFFNDNRPSYHASASRHAFATALDVLVQAIG